ncbi:MAG TPA: histidine phosphatase family protein [Thermoplasmata archaeon]|nr:histidine phosphatase family protein [Thermoplasmata archaeon]
MTEPTRPPRVIVVRHGPAELRDARRWRDDRERPLSRKGVEQTRRVAAGLARLIGPVATLASSPAVRARRTAELLRAAVDRCPKPVYWPELDVGRLAGPIFDRLRPVAAVNETVVVVGHEPTLAEFVGLALTGDGVAIVRLAKGGAACLEFPRAIRPGAARLRWLLTRRQLAGAAD